MNAKPTNAVSYPLTQEDHEEINSLFKHNSFTYGRDLRDLRNQPWDHSERPSVRASEK